MGLTMWKVDVPEGAIGAAKVERFEVVQNSIERLRIAIAGRGCDPGVYTRLVLGGSTVMSDTDAELRDLYPFYFALRNEKRVLINGLGLGVALKIAMSEPSIEHIDVVDNSQDVLELVSPHYQDKRVSFWCDDAFSIKWPKGKQWDVAWHDIWPAICGDFYEETKKLHRKYARLAKWQGSWCRKEMREASL